MSTPYYPVPHPSPAWQIEDRSLPSIRRRSGSYLEARNSSTGLAANHRLVPPDEITLPSTGTNQGSQSRRRNNQLLDFQHVAMKRRRPDAEGETEERRANRVNAAESTFGPRGQVSPQVRESTVQSHGGETEPNNKPLAIEQPQFTWRLEALTSGDEECCRPGCSGASCAKLRSVAQQLVSEVCVRDPLSSTACATGVQPPTPILPDSDEISTAEALEWALQRLQWNNASLRNLLPLKVTGSTSEVAPLHRLFSPPGGMKRRNDEADKEAEIPSRRPSQIFQRSDGPLHLVTSQPDESWRGFEAIDPPGQPSRHNQSASFSYGPPYGSHQSPTQGAQSMMMLPSPSSLNLPMPPTFPAISSPSPYTQTSVHNTHLQDLQHQVSVKTLAFQTLQREYDTIIQKIERSRIRTQTLEKKFEVSDAEIKSLSEEKERLTMQVQQLETQIETLQHAKDDARRTGAESAAQYMKIVEMAGQIQAQGVDSRKNWEKEKGELLDRIKLLELGRSSNPIGPPASRPASSGGVVSHSEPIQASTSDAQLRALLIRNEALEGALKAAKEESKSMREAALVLAGAGQRIETALDKALGDEIPQP